MAIKAYLIFYKACLLSLFSAKREMLLIKDLFTKFSYRYDKQLASSYSAPIIYFIKSIRLIFKRRNYIPDDLNCRIVVFENGIQFKSSDIDYLRYNGVNEANFIFRDQLPNELGFITRLGMVFFLSTLFICVLPIGFFSKNKARSSLILLEITENALLYNCLMRWGFESMYFLSAFEKDAYFTCYLVQSGGIHVSIIPSSNPISIFYRHVLCDKFIFTAPFQRLEFGQLKSNWVIGGTSLWKPFESQTIRLNKGGIRYTHDVGFVSSGMYLREKLLHTNALEKNDYNSEMALINAVGKFCEANQKSLIVYLHPFEKSSTENLELALNYYRGVFGKEVSFAPFNQPSKFNFDLAEVAVSGFSSAQIERLYGGYKTLFAPMGFLKNYFKDKRLDGISVNNETELEKDLLNSLNSSEEDFFKVNDLMDYHWKSYHVQSSVASEDIN